MLETDYKSYLAKKNKVIFGTLLVLVIVSLTCLAIGTENSPWRNLYVLINYFIGQSLNDATASDKVVVYLRSPRLFMAIVSGIGLAVSGTVMQSVTRNFLVSPFTLGVSSAAAFGASMCIVFGGTTIFFKDGIIIGSAFIMAMVSVLVIFFITKKIGVSATSIILVGIAMNYFFSALTASLQFFAQENKLAAVVQWTFGSFNRANWHGVYIIAVVVLFCYFLCRRYSLKLNVMASNDDETATSLGINPEKLRIKVMLISVLMTATIISFNGVIGFVGLVAPHMARILIGNDHKYLVSLSAYIGALLLVVADTIGKNILYPVNVPVGIVVSFIGVPIFVNLIIRSRKSEF